MRVYRVPCVPETADSTAWVGELAFAPDARRLAVVETQNYIRSQYDHHTAVRWLDLPTGEVSRLLPLPHAFRRTCVALSPDHSLLVAGRHVVGEAGAGSSARVERYELPNPHPALAWEVANYLPRSAACVPDGSGFAVALDNVAAYQQSSGEPLYAVCGWDGRTGKGVGPVELSWWSARSLAFSPDGRWLACAGHGGRVFLLDWPGGEWVGEFRAPVTERIRFAPARPLLAVIANKAVTVYDVPAVLNRPRGSDATRLATLQRGHRERVTDAAFSPSGEQLLTVSADETARVWSLAKRRTVRCFEWGIGPLTAAAWSPDGTLCAAAGAGGQIVVWDADG